MVRELHPAKAYSPIFVTPAGIVILFSFVQSSNAPSPIDVSFAGSVTAVSPEQLENALPPIPVQFAPDANLTDVTFAP